MGTHIPAQNEHENIVNMPPTGRFEHGRAPRLVSSSRKGRGGAMRANGVEFVAQGWFNGGYSHQVNGLGAKEWARSSCCGK